MKVIWTLGLLGTLAGCAGEEKNPQPDDTTPVGDTGGCANPATLYGDSDGDGYGDNADEGEQGCLDSGLEPGRTTNADDCDDADPGVNPGAEESCDGLDDDCDGDVDEDVLKTWYLDADGDGYGDEDDYIEACEALNSYDATEAGDCDDGDPSITGPTAWHPDADGDGFGAPDWEEWACETPTGGVADSTDCDDAAEEVYPGAPETCDGVDEDCDGVVDDPEDVLGTGELCPALDCAALLEARPEVGSGTWWISPRGEAVEAACDMDTDGGGWTRVFGINIADGVAHDVGDGDVEEGIEAAARGEGHVSSRYLGDLRAETDFAALRFECEKDSVGRKIHLVTTDEDVIGYFTGEEDCCVDAEGSFDTLVDDSSYISEAASRWGLWDGKYEIGTWGADPAAVSERLYNHAFFAKNSYHWLLDGSRYECDDFNTGGYDGYWYVWVR